jgi:hypothetical protein
MFLLNIKIKLKLIKDHIKLYINKIKVFSKEGFMVEVLNWENLKEKEKICFIYVIRLIIYLKISNSIVINN